MSERTSTSRSNSKRAHDDSERHKSVSAKEGGTTPKGKKTDSQPINTRDNSSASPNDTQKKDTVGQGTTSEAQLCPHHPCPIDSMDFSYIGYGIYVGNAYSVCSRLLQANGITHVLSVGGKPWEELSEKKFKTKYVEVEDGPGANVKEIFDISFEFIDEGTKGTNKILVHCLAGFSCSTTVVTGYLQDRKNFTWRQAQLWVADKRPQLWPDATFLGFMAEQASKENGGHKTFTVADFVLPGQSILGEFDRIDANRKYLKSLDLKEIFSGCEEDKRKNEKVNFSTEKAKEALWLKSIHS